MKKILLILLFNVLTIALIYSTYIKSRKTITEVPKGASVVSEDSATPDDRVLYGKEYSTEDIEIFIEEDMDEEYIEEATEVLAMFPAGVVRNLADEKVKIILYTDKENKNTKENALTIYAKTITDMKKSLIESLCEYTDKTYEISSSSEYQSITDRDFTEVMKEYVSDKKSLRNNEPLIYEYLDNLFKGNENIEEILKRQ